MQIDLVDFLSLEGVWTDAVAEDKYGIIDELVTRVMQSAHLASLSELSTETVVQLVREREDEKATGLERGVAFPHARIPGLDRAALGFAILPSPVDFQAQDQKPATFVCLMLIPDDQPALALTLMATIIRVLSSKVNRAYLSDESDPARIRDFMLTELRRTPKSITAGELMRFPTVDVHPETPIREVSRLMADHHIDAVSVIAHDGTMLGEITCAHLATQGIPDFFNKLKTVSFLSEFDPLEKYFEKERDMIAQDAMTSDFSALPEDATLLEVIFELAVRKHSKVYVLREGRRVGVIDWNLMLNRVINI